MLINTGKALALAASVAGLGIVTAAAGEPSRTLALKCAERDLQVVTAIEDRGSAGEVAPVILGEAALSRMQAQATCYQGRVGAALALYDRILARLDPVRLGAVQARYPD